MRRRYKMSFSKSSETCGRLSFSTALADSCADSECIPRQAAYNEYRSRSKKDIQEKDKILQNLLKNFEDIEASRRMETHFLSVSTFLKLPSQRLSKTLQERSVFFEDNRYAKTESYLSAAEQKRAGGKDAL
jgi:hypothetical protein